MANIILENSYTESANKADVLKTSNSAAKSKESSNDNFLNILSGFTDKTLGTIKQKTDLSKKAAAHTHVLPYKNFQNTSKNVQKNDIQSQKDNSQINNDNSKSNSKMTARTTTTQAANAFSGQATTAKSVPTNNANVNATTTNQVQNDSTNDIATTGESQSNQVTPTETQTSTVSQDQSNDTSIVEQDLATTITADVTALVEDAAQIIPDVEITDEVATEDEVQSVNSDNQIDAATVDESEKLDTTELLDTLDNDIEVDADKSKENDIVNVEDSDNTNSPDNDDVMIKVSTETVDAEKKQDKDVKNQSKQDAHISKEILNELDATVVNLEQHSDDADTDSFSSGQNALEQAVMLSIEGASETSDTQDFSKLLNVDMLKQVDAKANVNALNNIQAAKPATNVDILNQISEKIAEMRNGTADKIEIALKPANLGKVNIEISSAKGVLTATLVAENEHVRSALDKNIDSLKSSLASQGFNVNSVTVKVSDAEKSAMNNNFDFSKEQFMNNSQNHSQNERAQETYNSNKSDIGSSDENSKDDGDVVLTAGNTNDNSYYKGLVDYKI